MYVCKNCGYETKKWMGKCPKCKEWDTFEEKENIQYQLKQNSNKKKKLNNQIKIKKRELSSIKSIEIGNEERFYLKNLKETNKIFGDGIMKNSLTLLSGEPGIGKSTLLLQIIDDLANQGYKCCYISAEENKSQIKQRYDRLNLTSDFKLDTTENLLEIIENTKNKDFLIIDSIQRIYIEGLGEIGGPSQIRNCTVELMNYAKNFNKTIILIGQITKDNTIAGPKILEHMVDTVLFFENFDEQGLYRYIRTQKNRFGQPGEITIYEMTEKGLVEISNPALLFIDKNIDKNKQNAAISIILENNKPIFVEIQALTIKSASEKQFIQSIGIENKRIFQISAILQKHLQIPLSINNILISVKYGIKIKETYIDLAVAGSILSSYYNKPVYNYIFIGELGLTGEIIPAKNEKKLINEVKKLLPEQKIIANSTGFKNIKDLKELFL